MSFIILDENRKKTFIFSRKIVGLITIKMRNKQTTTILDGLV